MELKKIAKFQKDFDLKHFPAFWKIKSEEDFLSRLEYLAIALAGEVGEFANLVKKIRRRFDNLEKKISKDIFEKLKEELTDVFIYVLISSNLLKMDLEKEYFKKMKINEKKFREFRKKNEKIYDKKK